ncbi:uncharacterized protein LOC109512541 [Hippocampus comes]|uniref:uncharacterized protein LOC109512541 n=1 Tax=Hippocampus comes TaxID=109280 RepID=UPI00094F1DE3|nr:PREDICTED: uncharacterized protein LOC109512541 [Hippocampus comes]
MLLLAFQMIAGCCALFLLCCILNGTESSNPSLGIHKARYSNSFRLARSTRTRVQQLLSKYKEQQLGNKDFEDRSGHLDDLPLLSTDFNSWLQLTVSHFFKRQIVHEKTSYLHLTSWFRLETVSLAKLWLVCVQDWERLQAAFSDMQAYRNRLEWKRKELEREAKEKKGVQTLLNTLPKNIKHVEMDLRDLMSHVSNHMSYIKTSNRTSNLPTVWTPLNPSSISKTLWEKRVDGYIILRDLDLYLTKLARDFLLLASKAQ